MAVQTEGFGERWALAAQGARAGGEGSELAEVSGTAGAAVCFRLRPARADRVTVWGAGAAAVGPAGVVLGCVRMCRQRGVRQQPQGAEVSPKPWTWGLTL